MCRSGPGAPSVARPWRTRNGAPTEFHQLAVNPLCSLPTCYSWVLSNNSRRLIADAREHAGLRGHGTLAPERRMSRSETSLERRRFDQTSSCGETPLSRR